jgi:nucleoside-diphosphate-sugar epimerase
VRAFVTGHRGYIGVHLVEVLRAAGHEVTGCDLGLFADCAWREPVAPDRELVRDVRALTRRDLVGHDCVMHLAALSNDPMGAVDEALTLAVNRDASIRLAELAKQAGVPRFLFSGSCSVYGKGEKLDLDESDPLHPLTAYARSKIDTEAALFALADDTFSPASLRNATAYGDSPMLRIDLVANNLLASALAYGEIRIMSDGAPWRPLVHCRDIARAFLAFGEAPRDAMHGRAVNVGGNHENYQVRDVAEKIARLVPGARIRYTGEVGVDPRDYRVRFDLLGTLLPEFRLAYDLDRGLTELHARMLEVGFGKAEFEGDRFVRLRALAGQMERLRSGAAA